MRLGRQVVHAESDDNDDNDGNDDNDDNDDSNNDVDHDHDNERIFRNADAGTFPTASVASAGSGAHSDGASGSGGVAIGARASNALAGHVDDEVMLADIAASSTIRAEL
jgi:hypothetical protein